MNFKEKSITTLALLVVLVPYLGFPGSWENAFLIISGLLIIGLTVTEWIERTRRQSGAAYSETSERSHQSAPREERSADVAAAAGEGSLNHSDAAFESPIDDGPNSTHEQVDHRQAEEKSDQPAEGGATEDTSSAPSFLKW